MKRILRRAVFLDRDGVLNQDRGYVSRPEEFEWLPGVMHALRALQRAGRADGPHGAGLLRHVQHNGRD